MKNEVLKSYERMVISRQFLIMLVAGPIPAALIKLQGTLLDETMISVTVMLINAFGLSSYWFAKYMDWKKVFLISHIGCVVCLVGFLLGFIHNVDPVLLILCFPTMMCFFLMLGGIYSSQMKNILKDKYKEEFDLGLFENKKKSAFSAAGFLGQAAGILFYMYFSLDALLIYLVLEIAKGVFWLFIEIKCYKLIKSIE